MDWPGIYASTRTLSKTRSGRGMCGKQIESACRPRKCRANCSRFLASVRKSSCLVIDRPRKASTGTDLDITGHKIGLKEENISVEKARAKKSCGVSRPCASHLIQSGIPRYCVTSRRDFYSNCSKDQELIPNILCSYRRSCCGVVA